MNFQISPLPLSLFSEQLISDEQTLAKIGAEWRVVDEIPGFPCRVSLEDAQVGERVLLINFTHHKVDSPYRASGPIFVREKAQTAQCAPNVIPSMLINRTLSLRAYNASNHMVTACVVEGKCLVENIKRIFEQEAVDYLHIHNAGAGCYSCAVYRI